MAVAGFCGVCGQHVWLTEQWGCVNGHPYTSISNCYDPDSGAPITPPWLQPAPVAPAAAAPASAPAPAPAPVAAAPAPVAATRLALLADILALLGQYPGYRAQYGTDTDIVIDNQLSDVAWSTGKKKVEYSAILKAVEAENTVYFWEVLKEKAGGLNFGGFEAESYSTFGTKRSGTTKGITLGPGGVVESHEWDYAATRQIIESVAAKHGWRVKTVLKKKSASW